MSRAPVIFSAFLCLVSTIVAQAGWDPNERRELIQDAQSAIEQFRIKDPSLADFFDQAYGWVVYPMVGKAGYWIGGAYGKGVAYQQGKVIGFSDLKQVSIGLQIGGQVYSEVVFFRDKAAMERLKQEKLEFDAQVSAVAVDKGAAANADYHEGVAVFTLAKGGLMAEASVGGQKFSYTPK